MRTLLNQFDLRVTNWISSWPQSLQPTFTMITNLGDPVVTVGIGIIVAIFGLVQSNDRLVIAGATVWATLGLGSVLKLLFSRERPMTEYVANMTVDTHSFPSGHASGSTIAYGLLAYLAWHLLPQPFNYIVVALLVLLIIAIGISRVYLGAHFPSDVVAGWVLGIIALLVLVFIVKPIV